jgi:hypothetical protein
MKYEINLTGFQRFDEGTYVTLLGKSQFVTLHDAICSRAYGKSVLLSCWVDLLHFDYIETNVSHAPPRNPIYGILVARQSRCETWLPPLTS